MAKYRKKNPQSPRVLMTIQTLCRIRPPHAGLEGSHSTCRLMSSLPIQNQTPGARHTSEICTSTRTIRSTPLRLARSQHRTMPIVTHREPPFNIRPDSTYSSVSRWIFMRLPITPCFSVRSRRRPIRPVLFHAMHTFRICTISTFHKIRILKACRNESKHSAHSCQIP